MSMFSQSLQLGDDTFSELVNPQQPKNAAEVRPPESMGIIEESPTSNLTCNRTRSRLASGVTLRRTQKPVKRTQSDTVLGGTTRNGGKPESRAADNYSAFFRSELDLEFKENVPENTASKPPQAADHTKLDAFFGDSDIEFIEEEAATSKRKSTRVTSDELGDIFAKSDFLSQPSEDEPKLDMPISTEDLDEMSFEDCSFPAQTGPSSTKVASQEATIIAPAAEAPNTSDIMWEDSVDFANTFTGESNPQSSARPADDPDCVAVFDEVARGIDSVTFTQEFLPPPVIPSEEEQRQPHSRIAHSPAKSQSHDRSVHQFIQLEMDKCKRAVSRGLAQADQTVGPNDSLLNASSASSQIVLNYSADSLPMPTERIGNVRNIPNPARTEQKVEISRTLPTQNLNHIDQWGLSKSIVDQYHRKGIKTMFDWQVECLSNTKVLFDGANLVYSAPTSAGKTLVSELLMIKNCLEHRRKSLFILPFISVVREKMFYLQELLTPAGLTVEGFFGGYTPPCGFDATNIAVCTIEKANSIVNKLLEQQRIEQLGCIVVDEIHLISDPSRGYILELLLTKILYACRRFAHRIQIVTMSATLPNLDLLTRWLQAEFYRTDFRPVALNEMLKIDSTIYDQRLQVVRQLSPAAYVGSAVKDQDNIGQLCVETLLEGCAVIVFCPSKDWCESLSTHVAGFIYAVGKSKTDTGQRLRSHLNMAAIEELKTQLRSSATGLDAVLEKTVSYACAFHHAGLTTDERDIIECAFKAGTLKVLVATSTLSSGVNLPARRVIIRTPLFGGRTMNSLTYKQMIGRAGRTGKDTLGESILICGGANTAAAGKELVCATLPPLRSCLEADGHVHLKRAILEVIAAGMATSTADLEQFTNATLLASEKGVGFCCATPADALMEKERSSSSRRRRSKDTSAALDTADLAADANDPIAACLKFLVKYEFVRLQSDETAGEAHFVATRLGMACLASSMPPGDGFLLFSELQKSRQNFVLESELHAVYLVTPFSVCYQMQSIDWLGFLDMWEKLPAAMRRVGEMVGVKESFLVKAMRAQKLDFKALQVHKRFYTALALQELVNEVNVNTVAAKYKCSRGMLQSLQQMASTFAGVVTAFCTVLNWQLLALIIEQFRERLFFGVHRDLIDLMRLPNFNGQRARCVFDGGYKTLAELANADGRRLERILYDSVSFDAKQREGETDFEAARRNKVRCMYITGKAGLTVAEAAKLLIEDARRYLEQEMGLQNVQWREDKEEEVAISVDAVSTEPSAPPELVESLQPRISPKRKSSEPPENAAEMQPPSDQPRRSGTRKSPRIEQHQVANKTPEQLKISKDTEIIATPVQSQTTRTRSQLESLRTAAKTVRKPAPSTRPIENPMQNEIIDPDSIDSIRFSRSKNEAEDSSNSLHNSSHILSVHKSSGASDEPNPSAAQSLAELDIISVCGNAALFEQFCSEITAATELSLSLGVAHNLPSARRSAAVIGGNLLRADPTQAQANDTVLRSNRRCVFDEDMLYVHGVAICIADSSTCFYMEMQDTGLGSAVAFDQKSALLQTICARSDITLRMYDAKEQCKALRRSIPSIAEIACRLEDPRIANWLLQPEVDCDLREMAEKYAPECTKLCCLGGDSHGKSALGLHYMSDTQPKLRAAIDCAATAPILAGQRENLRRLGSGDILKSFAEMEMPIQHSLVAMECTGMPVDSERLEATVSLIDDLMRRLEANMYRVHGRRFNVASSSEVAKVLGMRGARNKLGKVSKVSTAKGVLQKMTDDPMSGWVMQWRQLSATLTSTLRPLQQTVYRERIHGSSWSLTQTGRISMHEPNVQNVAKDIVVHLDSTDYSVSCRSCFLCPPQRLLLSADFCQLELRILSHLSGDPLMLRVMQSAGDVFTTIGATWNGVREAEVTAEQRNRTKQICYGIIYGMGARAMADTLQTDEDAAREMMDSFHRTYPGIRTYTEQIVSYARQQGYVETLAGRRRYLPAIQAADGNRRAQAERQAVNTTIQGSAADVAKYAILRMERNLRKYARTLRVQVDGDALSRVDLVLHLHDELIYEVPADRVKSVAKVLRSSMENCAKMSVPLRVKLKAGSSWGEMVALEL